MVELRAKKGDLSRSPKDAQLGTDQTAYRHPLPMFRCRAMEWDWSKCSLGTSTWVGLGSGLAGWVSALRG